MALQWVWPELWLDPQQTSGEAAPLVTVASVAASLAALGPQLTSGEAALVALQWVWPKLWLDPQQTSGEAASLVTVALVVGNHRQALCWAALVTLVAPATAPLAALDLQQASGEAALVALQWV